MKGLIEIIEEKREMKGFLARVYEKKRESFGWIGKKQSWRRMRNSRLTWLVKKKKTFC